MINNPLPLELPLQSYPHLASSPGLLVPRHSAGSNCGRASSKTNVEKQHMDQAGGGVLLQFAVAMRKPKHVAAEPGSVI